MCALSTLQFYHDRVYRVVEEALEVALVLCNTELREFTVGKIFDIFNQILPTAFIIGTSYWPYYHTLQKQKLCVCARYGIICRHFRARNQNHFIDMDSITPDESLMFRVKKGVTVMPSQYFINVIPLMTDGTSGYSISIKFTLKYQQNFTRGVKRAKKDEHFNVPESAFPVSMCCRYNFQREYYTEIHTIRFEPNPLFHESYGSMFPGLVNIRPYVLSLHSYPTRDFSAQRYMQVHAQEMPDFTLVLQHVVNMPLFVNYSKMVAVPARASQPVPRRPAIHRGTQTPSEEHLISESYGQYRQRTSHLRTFWSDTNRDSILDKSTRENAIPKNQDISDEVDLQETTVTTTANVNSSTVNMDNIIYDDDFNDDQRSVNSDALIIIEENADETPKPLSPMQGSPECNAKININPEKSQFKNDFETYLDDNKIINNKTKDRSIDLSRTENSSQNTAKNSCRFRKSKNQCHSTRIEQNRDQQNWTNQKFDNSQYQQKKELYDCPPLKDQQQNFNEPWPDYEFQTVACKRHRRTSVISPHKHSFNYTATSHIKPDNEPNSTISGDGSWPIFTCGTSYASNRIYGLSYAQVASSNPTATITSGSLQNEISDINQEFFLNENNVYHSPDSTNYNDYESKPVINVKKEGETEKDESAEILDWISSKTPSDFVLLTDEDIDQHFQDMEEIIRDDTIPIIKEEHIDE